MNRSQRRAAKTAHIEQREERIAPAAQRKPVITSDGLVIRGPHLEPFGKGFIRSNPLRALWLRSQTRAARAADENARIITDAHFACAERLLRAWSETAEGVNVSPAAFMAEHVGGGSNSSRGAASAGSLLHQIAQAEEWHRARNFLGNDLWKPIEQIVLIGVPVSAWAKSQHWDEKFAMGYFVGALDRLVAFYKKRRSNA